MISLYGQAVLRWLLNHLPSGVLLVFFLVGAVAIALVAEVISRRRPRSEGSDELLGSTFEFIGVAYAILVGFVIVALWQTSDEARSSVQHEAAELQHIGLLADNLAPTDRATIHGSIRGYVTAAVDDEWRLLREGDHSEAVDDAARDIVRSITQIDVSHPAAEALQGELLGVVGDFAHERTERLALANSRLAGQLWLLVLVASVGVILLTVAFSENRWGRAAPVFVAIAVGLVLFSMSALSYPFSSGVSLSPEPLREVLHELDT